MAFAEAISKERQIETDEQGNRREILFRGLTIGLGGGAIVWGAICLIMNWFAAASIPLSYALFSVVNYQLFLRKKSVDRAMFWQTIFSLVLPFLFQFVLGGWLNTGLVMIWSLVPLLLIIAYRANKTFMLWVAACAVLICVSIFWTPEIANVEYHVNEDVRKILLAINLVLIFTILGITGRFFVLHLARTRHASAALRTDLATRNEHLETSMRYAQRIQAVLTPNLKSVKFVLDDQFQLIQQKEEVGGDTIWVGHEGDHVIIALIDCTGHGVPGSMLTFLVNDIMNESVHFMKFTEAQDIVLRLMLTMHDRLASSAEMWTDNADLGVLSFNRKTGAANFSGCGVDLIKCTGAGTEVIKGQKTIVGLKQLCQRPQARVSLDLDETGTSFYMSSDGIVDLFGGPNMERFGSQRFIALIEQCKNMPFPLQKKLFAEEIANWKGEDNTAIDDISVIGLSLSKAFLELNASGQASQTA